MFQRSNDEFPNTKKKNSNRDRRDAIASSHSAFEIKLEYVDSVFHNPLPSERRLIGKFENLLPKIGLNWEYSNQLRVKSGQTMSWIYPEVSLQQRHITVIHTVNFVSY